MAVLASLIKADKSLDSKTRVTSSDTYNATIWTGSGYSKAKVQFKVDGKFDTKIVPASSKDYKILEQAWDVDSSALKQFIGWANDLTDDNDVVVSILTSTETHWLSNSDDSGDYVCSDKLGVDFYYCER